MTPLLGNLGSQGVCDACGRTSPRLGSGTHALAAALRRRGWKVDGDPPRVFCDRCVESGADLGEYRVNFIAWPDGWRWFISTPAGGQLDPPDEAYPTREAAEQGALEAIESHAKPLWVDGNELRDRVRNRSDT